jgi:hypothetical protein
MIIFTIGTYGVNSLILGWCGSTCGQTPEKRAVAIGIVTTIMNASFIWYGKPLPLSSRTPDLPGLTNTIGRPTSGPSPMPRATSLRSRRRRLSLSLRSCSRGLRRSCSCAATRSCARRATRSRPSSCTEKRHGTSGWMYEECRNTALEAMMMTMIVVSMTSMIYA